LKKKLHPDSQPTPQEAEISPLMILRRRYASANSRLKLRQNSDGKSRRSVLVRRLIVESLCQRRVLATITGTVFEDIDGSMHRNNAEPGLISRIVYIDSNSNTQLDLNEQIAITDSSGQFEFTNLLDGQYKIAVYNGTDSQIQTVPVRSSNLLVVDELTSTVELLQQDGSLVLTNSSILSVDLTSGNTLATLLPTELSDAAVIPGGRVLATLAGNSLAVGALLVDPIGQTQSSIDLTGGQAAAEGFSTIAIDNAGFGLLLESSNSGLVPIRHINASDPENILVTVTSTQVDQNTEIHQSPAGTRTLLALPTVDGYEVSLWSNATGTLITSSPISIESTVSVAAFDDDAGLLAMRTDTGSLKFYDVDANFSPLYEIDQPNGPIFIDAARDRVFALSVVDSLLSVFDSETGSLTTQVELDVAAIGDKLQVAVGEEADTLVTLGATGFVRSKLNQPDSYTATITDNTNFDSVRIGMKLVGTNTAPQYTEVPSFTTPEDVTLVEPAPAAKNGSQDTDGDQYIVIRRGQAANGTADINFAGRLTYAPDLDFNGSDSVTVWLHDGRDHSPETDLPIDVTAVADSPTGIQLTLNPVPENLPVNQPFGIIDVIDVDGINHLIMIDDPRFRIIGNQIVLIGGPLNFELEPQIQRTISATDNETNETVSVNVTITVEDVNEPITGITPTSASVPENRPGEFIAELEVVDEDLEQFYFFTTDDDRFIVDNFDLRLADGVALNYEAGQTITFNVTATEFNGEFSLTQEFTINVVDVPEQPTGITITGSSVRELVPGDVVGDVLLDNSQPHERFELTTDHPDFEIVGNVLKLVDSAILQLNSESQISLTIFATDSQGQFLTIDEDFVIDVLANDYPSHNIDNPFDVDHSGVVEPTDALDIVNYLRVHGPGPVGPGNSLAMCYDVNGDGVITALDALLVINHLRRRTGRTSGGEGGTPSQSQDSSRRSIALDQPLSKFVAPASDDVSTAPLPTNVSKIVSTAPNESKTADPIELPKADKIDEAFAQDSEDEDWRLA
jgi:Dockerin type I domain/Bacterial Ig domain